jgi:hypothetical protein
MPGELEIEMDAIFFEKLSPRGWRLKIMGIEAQYRYGELVVYLGSAVIAAGRRYRWYVGGHGEDMLFSLGGVEITL